MLTAALALALFGATLGLHVVEVKDVELDRAFELTRALGEELRACCEDRLFVDGAFFGECADETACARELAKRDGTGSVILLRFYATPNVLLLTASRRRADGAPVLAASRQLGERSVWRSELTSLARELAIDRAKLAGPSTISGTAEDETHLPWFWIGAGTGTALALAGVGFALGSKSARDDLLDGAAGREHVAELNDRVESDTLLANVFFSAAVGAVLAGIVVEVVSLGSGE